jgi:hypothetical protein
MTTIWSPYPAFASVSINSCQLSRKTGLSVLIWINKAKAFLRNQREEPTVILQSAAGPGQPLPGGRDVPDEDYFFALS